MERDREQPKKTWSQRLKAAAVSRPSMVVLGAGLSIGGLEVSPYLVGRALLAWLFDLNPRVAVKAPDSPIVIRGGSLNLFGNGVSWTPYNNSTYLYQVDLGKGNQPVDLTLDGFPDPTSNDKRPIINGFGGLTGNWAISIQMREDDLKNVPTPLELCTELTADPDKNPICNKAPDAKASGEIVYFQIDPKAAAGTILDHGYDRKGLGARMHYTVPNCKLDNPQNLDPECTKIKSIQTVGISAQPQTLTCLDGACSIGIDIK